MALEIGQELLLAIEKPAAGGRMIARHDGQVVFVAGAIPGERVRVRIERVEKGLAFAAAIEAVEPSPDRRDGLADPLCGGFVYSHIRYQRQLTLKAEVIADAFTRLGRLPPAVSLAVVPSPERGYRMRSRFHVRGSRAGFFREGTREICDASVSGQLLPASLAAAAAAVAALVSEGAPPVSVELSENIAATERALHAEVAFGARVTTPGLERAAAAARLAGITARTAAGVLTSAGSPTVGDPFALLTGGRAVTGELRRHPASFFQANRYLLSSLVTWVLDAVPADASVLDLYAGVGLFALSLAACGRTRITAVEGDPSSGSDLQRNAQPFGAAVRVVLGAVEAQLARRREPPDTLIVDPPRTGISKAAMQAVGGWGARRVVYVSCDPATMARDARRLVDAGYRMGPMAAFDLFPNTPHVETVAVFER
jgi:23S rRNA (uracil1939-C5)-methyltransferase